MRRRGATSGGISGGIGTWLLVLVLGWICSATASAQFRAGIQGAVTDTQGAAVIGAAIRLTSKETNKVQETKAGAEGFYRFDRLAPGDYTITVEMTGFKKMVLESVLVQAEDVQGVNIRLETGAVSEMVTVSDEATEQLHSENPNLGGAITKREIRGLPQLGRDPYELVRLAPGVFGLGARSGTGGSEGLPNSQGPGGSGDQIFATENRPAISAAGQRVESNNIQIDGVTSMSQAWGGAAVVTPNQESVKEVRVLANSYSAEYGRNTGAQVLVVSENGTNTFHGSFFFKRNTPGLNSYQNFTRAGTALDDPQRVNQFLSQWGGSLGGPVLLPRFGTGGSPVWKGTDKLFFFFSYETTSRSSSRLESQWIETPEFVNQIRSFRPNSIANRFLSFPGSTPRVAAVQSRDCESLLGKANLPLYPCQVVPGGVDVGSLFGTLGQTDAPNEGAGLDGIPDIRYASLTIPDRTKAEQFNPRIDFQATKNDLVAFSAYYVPNTRTFNDADGNRGRPGFDFTSARRNMVGTLLWTRTLSPTMINEARFNVTRWYFDEQQSNPNVGWGLPADNICFGQCVRFGNHVGPGVFYQTTYNFRDTVSKVVNAHGLKFGVDVISEQDNDRAPWAGRPTYDFGNLWNFANDAPTNESAFFDPATGQYTDLAAYARSRYYGAFIQDDWKARPNLTLNLGLRWEYFTPLHSDRGRISNLVLGPNGSLLDARIQSGGSAFKPDRNNFGPQVGFAWSPGAAHQKLVLRGGFGTGFNRLPGSRLLETRFNPPFFANFTFNERNPGILYGTAADLNSFNYPANPSARLTFDPTTGMPTSGAAVNVNATLQDVPNSYAYRYSLAAEYELGGWVASLAYQGSAAHKLPRLVPYQKFVAPNPRLQNINLMLTDANSNFNALLAGVSHRFARGFMVNSEYRWSKSLDTCSNDHDCRQSYPFDQSTEYGPSDFDVRHTFKTAGVWTIPNFRQKKDFVSQLVGGWELSGILTASSGFPWTPVVGGDLCNLRAAQGSVCPLRPLAQLKPGVTATGNDTFLGAGLFPGDGSSYFISPTEDSFASPPRPGVGRNSLRGPGYFSVDLTALKRFTLPSMRFLGEHAALEIRANAYNLFNRLNLAPFIANENNTQIQLPDFGRAIRALSGRVAEIQVRFSF